MYTKEYAIKTGLKLSYTSLLRVLVLLEWVALGWFIGSDWDEAYTAAFTIVGCCAILTGLKLYETYEMMMVERAVAKFVSNLMKGEGNDND